MLPLLPRCLTRRLPQTPPSLLRTFTTTSPVSSTPGVYKQPKVSSGPIPSVQGPEPQIPPYPYGRRQIYKQSNTGLYGDARIRFGNNVSSDHGVKTRRKWRPNVHRKRLWSTCLNAFIQTRVTTRVMRTIDKCGGLDEYLLGSKPARVKELGPWGWRLRWRIMQTPAMKARFEAQREELGLRPSDWGVKKAREALGLSTDPWSMLRDRKKETEGRDAERELADGPGKPMTLNEIDHALANEEISLVGDEMTPEEERAFMAEQKPR